MLTLTAPLTVPVTVNDGALDSAAFNLSVEVTAVNDAPVATDDSYTVDEDSSLNVVGHLWCNWQTILMWMVIRLTAVLDTSTSSGTLTLNADGSFTYTPSGNFKRHRQFHLSCQRWHSRL